MRRKIAAGNWKMNGLRAGLDQISSLREAHPAPQVDIIIAPPATLIAQMAQQTADHPLAVSGQDCHFNSAGAHTGDISAKMLADAGASHVILGHSERRADHAESDDLIRKKARAALEHNLCAIICIGETLEEREAANTLDIIAGQLAASLPDVVTGANLIIAYEPVWAIGTGKIPTLDQIGEVHDFIRTKLEQRYGDGVGRSIRVLYGGSVKPGNAAEIFNVSNVDGALVGGASLLASDFSQIISALESSI